MASSSSVGKICFHCNDSKSVEYRNGWRLRSGEFALLCDRCASAYEDGSFCEIFHADSEGWRDCKFCGKLVHCGCIVSLDAYILMDFSGVLCTECSMKTLTMAANQSPPSLGSSTSAQGLQHLADIVEVEQFDDTEKVVAGDCPSASLGNIKIQDPVGPFGSAARYANSPNEADAFRETQIDDGKHRGDPHGRIQLHPQHMPKMSDHEIQQISRNANSIVIPLFEKTLSPSDADQKLARLVIPKRCAEAYFPEVTQQQGIPIAIHDVRGKKWVFHFRFWSNNNSKMYVLDGLKDYMISMQWQAGDKVTFYRIEPEGNLVMGLRKASSASGGSSTWVE